MIIDDILKIVLTFCFLYMQEEFLFYYTMKIYCKKNKGNCSTCKCWSCPKYIQDYENRKDD